jgi:hypothetical protein
MSPHRRLGTLGLALAIVFVLAGCSHPVYPTNGGGGGTTTSPVILTVHDTPATGITITSFEVTITGASLTPTGGTPISLLSTPVTLELTQLQANSALLSTTAVKTGSYGSLTVTFANPQYTFVNDTGASVTVGTNTCAAGASCVVAPTITASTMTFNSTPFPLTISQSQQNLLEVDLNLGNIVQSDFSVDFAESNNGVIAGTVTDTQKSVSGTPQMIGSLALNGSVSSVGTNTFKFAPSTGQAAFTIAVNSSTAFIFGSACTKNDFTCVTNGQLLNVQADILSDGSLVASSILFDDASGTQQLTGEIVALNGTPPTSFTMVVHNEVPGLSNAPIGTPITVTLGNTVAFNVNNFFQLPSGFFSFASPSDLLVGQEVEARLSGTFSAGPPAAFTTDRIMLDPSQLTATVSSVDPGNLSFFVNGLPSLFTSNPTGSILQIQILTDTSTDFQTPNGTFNDVTSTKIFAVGGFLFNTTPSPSIAAVVVRGPE